VSTSPAAGAKVHLQLLGGFEMSVDDRPIALPETGKKLIGYLALAGKPRDRALIAATLWPEKSDARAAANLRSCLWRLPKLASTSVIVNRDSRLGLDPNMIIDAREFERLGWSLVSDAASEEQRADWRLLDSDLLPGWYDEWVLIERQRIAQLQLHFMEALTYKLLEQGSLSEALDVAIRLVAADTLREGSQQALLTVYCAEGSLGQARRQLERYRTELLDTFDCEPALSIPRILAAIASNRTVVVRDARHQRDGQVRPIQEPQAT